MGLFLLAELAVRVGLASSLAGEALGSFTRLSAAAFSCRSSHASGSWIGGTPSYRSGAGIGRLIAARLVPSGASVGGVRVGGRRWSCSPSARSWASAPNGGEARKRHRRGRLARELAPSAGGSLWSHYAWIAWALVVAGMPALTFPGTFEELDFVHSVRKKG